MMMDRGFRMVGVVMVFLMFPAEMKAGIDYRTVEEQTMRLFLEQKWDSVIIVGKQGLKENIDYFYLRRRIGISYYELTKYLSAIVHLEKAHRFNQSDTLTISYLRTSYVRAGREEQARALLPRAGAEMRAGNDDQKNFTLSQVKLESGYTLSSDRAPGNLATLMGSDSIYGEQDLYGNNLYGNFGVKIGLFRRAEITLAYNYLDFNKTKYIQYGKAETHLDSISDAPFRLDYFYSYPWTIHDTSFNYHVKQNEGYGSLALVLPAGFRVKGAVHYVHVAYPLVSPSYRFDSIDDTAYYFKPDSSWHLFRHTSLTYSFPQKDTSFSNRVVFAGIAKDIGRFTAGISGTWSNLNGLTQFQVNGSLTWYPFGNLNFYGTTAVTGFFQQQNSRFLFSQVLGGRIAPWMWAEGNFSYGDFTNANILGGSIVYNNSDIIKYMGGASLVFPAGNHFQLSLMWQYSRKESYQLFYIKEETFVNGEPMIREIPQTKTNPYQTNSIIGGITWKF